MLKGNQLIIVSSSMNFVNFQSLSLVPRTRKKNVAFFSIPGNLRRSPALPDSPGESPSQSPQDPCARFCCSYDNVDSPNYARHLNGHGSPPATNTTSSQRDGGIHGGIGGASSPYNHNYSGDGSYQYGRFDASALHIAHALKQTELQKGYSKAREKPIDYYLVSHVAGRLM